MIHYFSRIEQQIKENWNSPALCDYEGISFTFGEVAAEIEYCHTYFKEHNIKKGDKIALCARNQARWPIAFLAINTYGAIVVPILDNFHPDGIINLIKHSGSKLLFTDMDSIKGIVPTLMLKEFIDKEKIRKDFSPDEVHYDKDNDGEIAVINYTSGSTGEPKGVMVRYECLSANIEFGQRRIPSHPGDNMLSILPMAHMFGMVFEFLYPLCGGATIWYLGKAPSPTLLIKAMQSVQPYLVIAVPMVFEKIFNTKIKPVINKEPVRSILSLKIFNKFIFKKIRKNINTSFGGKVRSYIIGGAAFNPDVEAFFKKVGLHFTVGYGMTEAAPLIGYEDWEKFELRSCGKAMEFLDVRIESRDMHHIPGEIQIKGTNVFSGYFKNEAATKEAFTEDGWFRTGDLGTIDIQGNIYIKGRSKSMLLTSNGQNVYPEEIESILNNLPQVYESVVVCRDGQLVALVFPAERFEPNESTASDIIALANMKLPKYSQISKIEFERDPFEKTPKLSIKRFLYK